MNLTGLALVYLPRKLWNTFLHWWYSLRSFVAVFNVLSVLVSYILHVLWRWICSLACTSFMYISLARSELYVPCYIGIQAFLLLLFILHVMWQLAHPMVGTSRYFWLNGDIKVEDPLSCLNFSISFFRYGFAMMGFSRKVRCFRVLDGHALLLGHTSMIHFTL